MSTKTLRKRIALVAVSAVGFGLMTSVTPASAALAPGVMVANTLYLGTTRDIDGTANAAAAGTGVSTAMTQVGWITDTSSTTQSTDSSAVYVNGSVIRSATVYPGAQISFAAAGSGTGTDGLTVSVTGGTMSQLAATQDTTVALVGATNINGSSTVVTLDNGGTAKNVIYGVFNVNAPVGSVATISIYSGSGITGLTTATAGTFYGQYQLTVVSASASGVYSAADSTVTQQACLAAADTAGSNSYDTTTRCANGATGSIYVSLKDAYSAELNGGTITATASNGALITNSAAASTGSTVYAATTSFTSIASDGQIWLYVKQPVSNTAGSSTVTISWNGTQVGSKTISWDGDVATLTVDTANSCGYFSTNQADTIDNIGGACVVYVAKDAAGNAVTLSSHPSVADATGALVGSTLSTTTSAAYGATQTSSRGYGYSMLVVPANALSGAGAYQLKLTNAAGAVIKSALVPVKVSRGSTDSFSVAWDKSSYKFGDIATLTITLKDAYGNLMADGTAAAGLTSGLTVSTAGFSAVGAACTNSSTTLNGVITCKYAALNTEGTYSYSVDLTTGTPQSATVGSLPISSSTTAVTNAEVLAAIVKLIASINKQIAALQKALTKKK